MTLAEWLSLGQFVVMAAAGFFVWWTGHQNKQHTDAGVYAREHVAQVIALTKAELRLEIERAERKAKHDAIEEVSGKLLQMSKDLDERLDEMARDLRDAILLRRKP